jgi:hypothetical protein
MSISFHVGGGKINASSDAKSQLRRRMHLPWQDADSIDASIERDPQISGCSDAANFDRWQRVPYSD